MNSVFLTLIIGSLVTKIVSQNNPQCIDNPTGEVSLNVRGIPGSKGDKGDIGPTGQKGNRGRIGSKGQKGVQGAEGIQGPVGPPGLEGSIGARGHPGHDGARGPPGKLGPPGLEGSIGPRGYPGHTGTQGPPGQPGPPGPRGRQGEPGDTVLDREVFNHINTKFDTVIRDVNSTLFDAVLELKTSSQTAINAVMTELKLMNKTLNTLKQMNAVTKCGISGNWRRIAHLDTTQGDTCPSNLRTVTNTTIEQTACGRTTGPGCSKLSFIIGSDYSNVCGRVRGYQYYSMDAFDLRVTQSDPKSASTRRSIDGYYVDGVSITQGQPLKHLWTYAVGVSEYVSSYSCPCAVPTGKQPTNPPEYVGNNYYCESGFPGTNYNRVAWEDPLWDGHNCMARNNCCDRYGWFHRQVPPSSDDITVRLCSDEHINNEDVLIDQFEIWVM